jgi:Tfp pilus assembly protein PilN
MIRINLAPTKRKRAAATAAPVAGRVQAAAGPGSGGAITFLLMFMGWIGLAAAGWYLLTIEDDAALVVRNQTAGIAKEVGEIKAVIDEAGLKAREEEIARQKVAIEKLEAKKRTPVFVMYELAMILTDKSAGGGVTIDEEKYKKNKADDPQSEINERWDPSGLWLTSVVESDGRLAIEGAARDAADLAEFTRRLRASVWFGEITHPNYERTDNQRGREDTQRHLTWKLDVAVRRWN